MNARAFWIALGVGVCLQLTMVVAGHFVTFIKEHIFAIGGMALSLIAGLIYAKNAGGKLGMDLLGGLLVGGACAFIGIAISLGLKDVPAQVLGFGTFASAITGLAGSALGRLLSR